MATNDRRDCTLSGEPITPFFSLSAAFRSIPWFSLPFRGHCTPHEIQRRLGAPSSDLVAIAEALWEEMERDERVYLLGEDIGVYGGAFKVTEGFLERFGEDRVIDTPIAEETIVGMAVGSAMEGFRPVAEFQYADFMSSGYVVSEAFAWDNRDGETLIVQYTERRRYELHRDGSDTQR